MPSFRASICLAMLAFVVSNSASPMGGHGKDPVPETSNESSLLPNNGAGPRGSASTQSASLHITFPPGDEEPTLADALRGILTANTYRGDSRALTGVFTQSARANFLHWSQATLSNPEDMLRYHFAKVEELPDRNLVNYLYLYRPMSPNDFSLVFRGENIDPNNAKPVAVFRARAQQPNVPLSGEVEVAGVEMIHDINPLEPATDVIPLGKLRDIAEMIRKGEYPR